MRARFKGWCKSGRHPVRPGELIQHVPGGWAHEACVKSGPLKPYKPQEFSDRALAGQDWPRDSGRALADTEYAQGYALAQHISDTARFFGEEAAAAEEYAWEMRLGDG